MRTSKRLGFAGIILAVVFLACAASPANAQHYSDFITATPLPRNSYLIIGIMGGIESWNAPARPVRKLALELRRQHLPNTYVETVEHKHWGLAYKLIRAALDQNRDGKLQPDELTSVHVILYGHSMGGASVVKLARKLKKIGVPVALTVQVDSIGVSDGVIPSNVIHAANLYQSDDFFIHGQPSIRAEDPNATEILANFRFDYKTRSVDLSNVNLFERIGGGAHTKMEYDPEVWVVVENFIHREIRQ